VIKAVLDTNILASGAAGFQIPQSIPGHLLRAWQAGQFQLLISEHILGEVSSTLQKPYFLSRLTPEQIARFELLLVEEATVVSLTVDVQGVATHPEDDLVLATAVSAQADYLVTGDGPLRRRVPSYQGVQLVTAREFADLLEQVDVGTQ
jgi:putative PIN family toxin of toxin-antitoxin system